MRIEAEENFIFQENSSGYVNDHKPIENHMIIVPIEHHLDEQMEDEKGKEQLSFVSFFSDEGIEQVESKDTELICAQIPNNNSREANKDKQEVFEKTTEVLNTKSNGCDISCQTPVEFLLSYAESLKASMIKYTPSFIRKISNTESSQSVATTSKVTPQKRKKNVTYKRAAIASNVAKAARAVRLKKTEMSILQDYTIKQSLNNGK